MKIWRSCKIDDLNLGTLPDLESRLTRHGVVVNSVSVEFSRYPDKITYDSPQDAANDFREKGTPNQYMIWVFGLLHKSEFSLCITRGCNIHGEEFLYVIVSGSESPSILDSVMLFFNLKPREPSTLPPNPPRTAFIAHRFDSTGTDAADKLARFLELLDFQVVTGRAYAPRSLREKVLARIEEQSIVFVILTPGSDDTWLIQESVLGDIKGKPLFILKETSVDFKPGILTDKEYIPFTLPHIDACFIPILEGLRDLGYFFSSKESNRN